MPGIARTQFTDYITRSQLKELFIEMGWNNDSTPYVVSVAQTDYTMQAIAQKEGFRIVVCRLAHIPEYPIRRSIERLLSQYAFHHLLIFVDAQNNQRWMIQQRHDDKPARVVEIPWYHGQDVEALYQHARGLFFTLTEEGNITIVDVIARVAGEFAANGEKVTKRFYERFTREHTQFKVAITNIGDAQDVDWYASLMLNRLMFCYFIQKKRFLDDNPNYLGEKLNDSANKRGNDQFYSFYRNFLLVLFHDGLGGRQSREQVNAELGRIPYLNGGLFDVHEIEQKYADITISDEAFARIFAFFDEYEWHLDTSPNANAREINPDVIGYIFEKYINDRAKMGAYYTKEDITEYISKNSIIPFLFDATARAAGTAIWDDAWELLRNSGDAYIYPAVKHGATRPLPAEIAAGISNVASRSEWNKPAPAEYANPTEIWREVVARRQRYDELCHTIANGDIRHINDLITYNLNIRQFCQDVLATTSNSEVIRHFYAALTALTVLDPTCGSGAFLFAALNILEPLYGECLNRMQVFVEERPTTRDTFGAILNDMRSTSHPNPQYFIYKSIILNNLYGVDIMKEATEIAKLRLFLKLVASVDADKRKPNLGIEPLPDIDFNIRAGNALVGFATKQALEDGLASTMDGILMSDQINALSAKVAQDFAEYKELQLNSGKYELLGRTKKNLQTSLRAINAQLNELLHQAQSGTPYDAWLDSHKPFHWFAEFYEIIVGKGGFDVIIGNPPYVAMKKVDYQISSVSKFACGDLYGYVMNHSIALTHLNSRVGMIVMHSLAFSNKFSDIRKRIFAKSSNAWFSFFGRIPAGLFSGDVRVRNCIALFDKTTSISKQHYTTRLHRWFADSRLSLIQKMTYASFSSQDVIPMYPSYNLSYFWSNVKSRQLNQFIRKTSQFPIYFKGSAYNWVSVSNEIPPCYESDGSLTPQGNSKSLFLSDPDTKLLSLLLLNGKLFFSRYLIFGDELNVTKEIFESMVYPAELLSKNDKLILLNLAEQLSNLLDSTLQFKLNAGKKVGTYNTSKLWHITDQSDPIFLKYLCHNPDEVFEAVNRHIEQTVLTQNTENSDDDDAGDEE